MSRPTGWKSYDTVAPEYERLTPILFGRLADDLVEMLQLDQSAQVLDAGIGTGTAADAARRRLGGDGVVIGVDPSLGMLAVARERAVVLAGVLPGLPFADASFDAAIANLVLSHLVELEQGAADLVRVVRSGGRVGVTAWPEDRESSDNDAPDARRLVDDALDEAGLPRELPGKGAPAEEWLKEEANLRSVLAGAGLTNVDLEVHEYRYKLTPSDYLGWHAWAGRGRYLASITDTATLGSFERHTRVALEERFPDGIRMVSHARLAVGTKPG